MRDLSIYIHIPFCVRKCLYCDFLSFAVPEAEIDGRAGKGGQKKGKTIESYVNLLEQEIITAAEHYREHQVISVFWGGGTPSLLPGETVCGLMEVLRKQYHILSGAEITIETNPGTVTADKLAAYREAGINRLSIGLQSTEDEELARIGRIHDYRTFQETYRMARAAGFSNINIDLMAALPGQSVASYGETLRRTAALAPEHISAYSLILEEGTPLCERQEQYEFPTEEEDREMYLLTDSCLSAYGYHRYEISNYAKAGYECRHNKVYWQRGDYVGFGLGAASMVDNVRWSNPAEPEGYRQYAAGLRMEEMAEDAFPGIDGDGGEKGPFLAPERQVLTVGEQMEEFMFLGLRMMRGVSRQEFARLYGKPIEEVYGGVLKGLYRQELLVCEADRIRLTARGIDVSNYVMAQFLQ